MKKVKVNTKPVADRYSGGSERIIEFSHANGGGLIEFRPTDDGRLTVSLYRLDSTVDIQYTYDYPTSTSSWQPTAARQDEVHSLTWHGDGEESDHYADSAITAPSLGIISAFWHLGSYGAIGEYRWAANLRAQSQDGTEIPDAGKGLGDFATLAEAMAAAQSYEEDNT